MSDKRGPILAHISAIDAELAERASRRPRDQDIVAGVAVHLPVPSPLAGPVQPSLPCPGPAEAGPVTTVPAAAITSASGVFSCSALEGRCGRRQAGQPLRRSPPRRLPWPTPAAMQTRSRLPATSACSRSTAVTAVATLDPLDNAEAAVLISGDGADRSLVGSHPTRQAAACTMHSPQRTRPRHCCPNTRYSLRH
jgi:hypothetical protein